MNLKVKIENILSYLPSRRIKLELEDSAYVTLLDGELTFLNITRLRYLTYLGVFLSCFLLYSDFFLGGFWEDEQVKGFIVLDYICAFATLAFFLATHIYAPKSPNETKAHHKYIVYTYLIFHVCWCAAVSSVESTTSGGFPTYLIGIFSASIIFLFRNQFLLIAIFSSVATLFGLLFLLEQTFFEIIQQFYSVVALIALSFFISRILLFTRVKSFIATAKLEILNKSLDSVVQERTKELLDTNKKLEIEIIERKKHEEELTRQKLRAEESDRLKTAFLGNMSHEIRTPLNGILGFGELLLKQDQDAEKRKKYIKIISSNSRQLLSIIENILDISFIEADLLRLNHTEINIELILDAVYNQASDYINENNIKGIELIKLLVDDSTEPVINSDYKRVQQVLYNLVLNAIKFTKKGKVCFGCKVLDSAVQFFVEDNGIGLTQEQAEFIFEPFRQVDESETRTYGGNGLGLAISKGIVEKLGGKIWHDKKHTKGARFCFTIPLSSVRNYRVSQ